MAELSSRLLKNAHRRHSERSEESLFDQNTKKREIPHFADSVRNDEFGVFQQAVRGMERRSFARFHSETNRAHAPEHTGSWRGDFPAGCTAKARSPLPQCDSARKLRDTCGPRR